CDVALLRQYIADLNAQWSEIKLNEQQIEDKTAIIDSSSYRNIQSEVQENLELNSEDLIDSQLIENTNSPVENFEDSLFRIENVSAAEKNVVEKFKIPSNDEGESFVREELVQQDSVEFNTSLRPFSIPAIDSKIAARISPIDENLALSDLMTKSEAKNNGSSLPGEIKKQAQALDFDWRAAIAQNTVEAGQTSIVKSAQFSSDLEKHIAIQSFALMTGELNEIQDWPLPVWRIPSVANYSYRYKSRLPSGEISNLVKSDSFNNILALSPLFYRVWHDRFASGILKKLGDGRFSEKNFQKINPEQCALLKRSNLLTHSEFQGLDQMNYYDARGLKTHIFYQYSKNAVYFDMSYYELRPLSHFYHSFVSTLISLKLDYYIPLSLSPQKHIRSLLSALVQLSESNFVKKLYGFFNDDKQRYIKQMKHLTPDRVLEIVKQLNNLSPSNLEKIWSAMRQHVYLVDLAMHLDLLGLCEFLTDTDLANKTNLHVSEIYSYHEDIPKLIIATTKLRFNSEAK
ncbi:MAG: hypothetical protein KBD78_16810, partial [Oligoflexales bacterium]|nr:hypothetical protein [Oligoflexales bacterium]